jgi:hypothetical protein
MESKKNIMKKKISSALLEKMRHVRKKTLSRDLSKDKKVVEDIQSNISLLQPDASVHNSIINI